MKPGELQAASAFARITTLGATYGIDLAPLFDRLAPVADSIAHYAMVTVPATFDRIAVATKLASREALEHVSALAADQAARLEWLARTGTRDVYAELETVPGRPDELVVTLQAFGERDVAVDLERLARFGVGRETLVEARAAVEQLGGRLVGIADRVDAEGQTWALHVLQPNADDAERAATRERLDRMGIARGATAAQRELVANLHDALAHARPTFGVVRVSASRVEPVLGVVWTEIAWPSVVRIALALRHHADPGGRIGELAGAIDPACASALELELGAVEPPPMRISATLIAGA